MLFLMGRLYSNCEIRTLRNVISYGEIINVRSGPSGMLFLMGRLKLWDQDPQDCHSSWGDYNCEIRAITTVIPHGRLYIIVKSGPSRLSFLMGRLYCNCEIRTLRTVISHGEIIIVRSGPKEMSFILRLSTIESCLSCFGTRSSDAKKNMKMVH